jgi:hypothetical protein
MNIVLLETDQTPSPSGSGELVMADAGHLSVVFLSKSHRVAVATFVNYVGRTSRGSRYQAM